MPRRRRFDAPGLLHHVMNRGLAHRTASETRRDVRYFLALLAREVRAGRIEILAFAILTTHFHLLTLSRTGELDRVMQRVLIRYVHYFNRTLVCSPSMASKRVEQNARLLARDEAYAELASTIVSECLDPGMW